MQDTWPTAAGLELESQPLADPPTPVGPSDLIRKGRAGSDHLLDSFQPSNSGFCIHVGKRKRVDAIIPLNLSREEPSSITQAHTQLPPTTSPSCQISSPPLSTATRGYGKAEFIAPHGRAEPPKAGKQSWGIYEILQPGLRWRWHV